MSRKSRTRVEVLTRNGLLKAWSAVTEPVATVRPAGKTTPGEDRRRVPADDGQVITVPMTAQTDQLLVIREPCVALASEPFTRFKPSGLPKVTSGPLDR